MAAPSTSIADKVIAAIEPDDGLLNAVHDAAREQSPDAHPRATPKDNASATANVSTPSGNDRSATVAAAGDPTRTPPTGRRRPVSLRDYELRAHVGAKLRGRSSLPASPWTLPPALTGEDGRVYPVCPGCLTAEEGEQA